MKSKMKLAAFRLVYVLNLLGFNPRRLFHTIIALPSFTREYREFRKQAAQSQIKFPFGRLYPALEDRFSEAGVAKGHYFWQDLLVARRIYLNNPKRHVDVGSRIDGFVSHVATFREIDVFDVRDVKISSCNIRFTQIDLMDQLNCALYGCTDSLSCLHTIEHTGLGRYGDRLSFEGYLTALATLEKLVCKGGKFYVSVPCGPQRIEFNAHRVFSVNYFLSLFAEKFTVDQFSYVDDNGMLHQNVPLIASQVENSFGCNYGCAILELTKL